MKKYIIFTISFVVLFSLFEVVSGMFLTFFYTPNVEAVWELSAQLPQEVVLNASGRPFLLTLLFALLSATIAYFILKGFFKQKTNPDQYT